MKVRDLIMALHQFDEDADFVVASWDDDVPLENRPVKYYALEVQPLTLGTEEGPEKPGACLRIIDHHTLRAGILDPEKKLSRSPSRPRRRLS